MSILSSMQVSLSGLLAQQQAIEITSHNIANANTPGYHRQEAVLNALPPLPQPGSMNSANTGLKGTGVEIGSIRRMMDAYAQQQIQSTQQEVNQWTTMSNGLTQIEGIIAPGQNMDLSSMLDQFFGAWQALSTHPEELSTRLTVRTAATNLTNTLNTMSGQLDNLQSLTATDLQSKVDRLNQLADNLADLNAKIGMATADGNNPNDYLDQRDQVLTEMAGVAGVSNISGEDTTGITSIGGHMLVEGARAWHVSIQQQGGSSQLVWDDGSAVNNIGGDIAGLVQIHDTVIPDYRAQLDTIAANLASSVNALHVTGVTQDNQPAGNFFAGNTAGSIHLDDTILANAANIATTTQLYAPGDGSLATDIYTLTNSPLIGNQTLSQTAQGLLSKIGNAVQTAHTNLQVKTAIRDAARQRDQQTGGVSLDEEMTNLIVYQRAYQASAHMMATLDQMAQTIIEKLG